MRNKFVSMNNRLLIIIICFLLLFTPFVNSVETATINQGQGAADLSFITLDTWWACIDNGTLYVRYLVINNGGTYCNSGPVHLNISLKNDSDQDAFAYIDQTPILNPFCWYAGEIIGGCIQIPLSKKPVNITAQVNENSIIPELDFSNNKNTSTVFNAIIISGRVFQFENQKLSPASEVSVKRCDPHSVQETLSIRFFVNKTGFYKVALFPQQPISDSHTYSLLFSHHETNSKIHMISSVLSYNETGTCNVTFKGKSPNIPLKPIGLPIGMKSYSLRFLFYSTDPDDDIISYKIKWDENQYSFWFNSSSFFKGVVLDHKWNQSGLHNIRVIAKDENGLISKWSPIKKIYLF